MRFPTFFAVFCLLAASSAPAQTRAAAASAGPIRIGIINIQYAIANTEQGKADEAKLKTRFAPRQQQLQSEGQAITAMQKKLQSGGDTLSSEAKADLASSIATKQKELRNDIADARSNFQNAENDMINGIGQKMVAVLTLYAQ